MNPNEFASLIADICSKYDFIVDYNLDIEDNVIVKSRIFLIDESFVEIYYNSDNGKISFALIKDKERIFGADNLGFWHIHPFDNPEKHIKCDEIKLEMFIEKVKDKLFK